jgi:hypothetical protein
MEFIMSGKTLNEEQAAQVVGGSEEIAENSAKTISNPLQMVCDNYFTRPGLYADPSKAPKICRYCFHLKSVTVLGKLHQTCDKVLNLRYV